MKKNIFLLRLVYFIITCTIGLAAFTSLAGTSVETLSQHTTHDRIISSPNLVLSAIDTCQDIECYCFQKKEIPISIIKSKTVIDSIFTQGLASYTGDTIYELNHQYKLAVVSYNDGMTCLYKFLLLLNSKTKKNTDYLHGSSDCDRDGLRRQYFETFEIKNNSIKIVHWEIPDGQEKTMAKIIKTESYLVVYKSQFAESIVK